MQNTILTKLWHEQFWRFRMSLCVFFPWRLFHRLGQASENILVKHSKGLTHRGSEPERPAWGPAQADRNEQQPSWQGHKVGKGHFGSRDLMWMLLHLPPSLYSESWVGVGSGGVPVRSLDVSNVCCGDLPGVGFFRRGWGKGCINREFSLFHFPKTKKEVHIVVTSTKHTQIQSNSSANT